jgi:ankyrin repeat protein
MAADLSWFFHQGATSTMPAPAPNSMYSAASRGDEATLASCLERGDNDTFTNGWNSLHVAAAKGHVECLKLLHRHVPHRIHDLTKTSPICNSLHLAAGRGKLACCVFLVEDCKIDADSRNSEGHTSLHIASHSGHVDVCSFLLSRSADVRACDSEGVSALLLSSSSGTLDVFRFLCAFDSSLLNVCSSGGQTALHKASAGGHLQIVADIVDRKLGDLNKVTINGSTSLHLAAQGGYISIVKILIDAGADPHCVTNIGQVNIKFVCILTEKLITNLNFISPSFYSNYSNRMLFIKLHLKATAKCSNICLTLE